MDRETLMKNGLSSDEVKRLVSEGKTNDGGDTPTKSVGEIIRKSTLTFFTPSSPAKSILPRNPLT